MADRQRTHSHHCWSWGPAHYECAVREIERLREQLHLANIDALQTKAERAALEAENQRLREALSDYYHQHRCGCGHPACKRCMGDRHMQEALAAGDDA